MSKAIKRQAVPTRWRDAVLVCGKCTRKVKGGFGSKCHTPLAKALRKRAGKGKTYRLPYGVIETGCLKLCPKGAIVAINGARPGDWQLVRPGEDIDAVARRLGLPEADATES
jgi:predicted metal-binding protein